MRTICVPVTAMRENAYIFYDETTGDGVVIDPGGEPEKLTAAIEREGICVRAILLTHGHCDHIGAVPDLKKIYDAPVVCGDGESPFLEDPGLNMSVRFGETVSFTPDRTVYDGELLEYAGVRFAVIHTPGHTPGGCCYHCGEEKILFSGDTLFNNSIGRSDFYLGDHDALINGIVNKLYALPDDTAVLPGHGDATAIGREKKVNPFTKKIIR